jgi:hypothetical protein
VGNQNAHNRRVRLKAKGGRERDGDWVAQHGVELEVPVGADFVNLEHWGQV